MTELNQAIHNIRATLNIQDRRGNPNAAFLLERLPQTPIRHNQFEEMVQEAIRRNA
jgi:hypothetical protein